MSLATWKAEFYPVKAKDCPEEEYITHALRKYIGTRKENLVRHEVTLRGMTLMDDSDKSMFRLDSETCALCVHYECPYCPLHLIDIHLSSCSDQMGSPWFEFKVYGNPEPMIARLEEIQNQNKIDLRIQKEEKHEN